ncbi:unnamed protein product [Amoebophrya sp. A120]|nr:unnamed protein product [Amoebophrya sp. A120]|eukprot:GSA120T00000275001.1
MKAKGLQKKIFFDAAKHSRIMYDAEKPSTVSATGTGRSLGVIYDGTMNFRAHAKEVLRKVGKEFDFLQTEKGWGVKQLIMLMNAFAYPAVTSISVVTFPYFTLAAKKDISTAFSSKIKQRLDLPKNTSNAVLFHTTGLAPPHRLHAGGRVDGVL